MTYPVKISWSDNYITRNDLLSWNEICAQVVERFGLPGGLYTTELTPEYMVFNFNEAEDALIARLSLGEYAKE